MVLHQTGFDVELFFSVAIIFFYSSYVLKQFLHFLVFLSQFDHFRLQSHWQPAVIRVVCCHQVKLVAGRPMHQKLLCDCFGCQETTTVCQQTFAIYSPSCTLPVSGLCFTFHSFATTYKSSSFMQTTDNRSNQKAVFDAAPYSSLQLFPSDQWLLGSHLREWPITWPGVGL